MPVPRPRPVLRPLPTAMDIRRGPVPLTRVAMQQVARPVAAVTLEREGRQGPGRGPALLEAAARPVGLNPVPLGPLPMPMTLRRPPTRRAMHGPFPRPVDGTTMLPTVAQLLVPRARGLRVGLNAGAGGPARAALGVVARRQTATGEVVRPARARPSMEDVRATTAWLNPEAARVLAGPVSFRATPARPTVNALRAAPVAATTLVLPLLRPVPPTVPRLPPRVRVAPRLLRREDGPTEVGATRPVPAVAGAGQEATRLVPAPPPFRTPSEEIEQLPGAPGLGANPVAAGVKATRVRLRVPVPSRAADRAGASPVDATSELPLAVAGPAAAFRATGGLLPVARRHDGPVLGPLEAAVLPLPLPWLEAARVMASMLPLFRPPMLQAGATPTRLHPLVARPLATRVVARPPSTELPTSGIGLAPVDTAAEVPVADGRAVLALKLRADGLLLPTATRTLPLLLGPASPTRAEVKGRPKEGPTDLALLTTLLPTPVVATGPIASWAANTLGPTPRPLATPVEVPLRPTAPLPPLPMPPRRHGPTLRLARTTKPVTPVRQETTRPVPPLPLLRLPVLQAGAILARPHPLLARPVAVRVGVGRPPMAGVLNTVGLTPVDGAAELPRAVVLALLAVQTVRVGWPVAEEAPPFLATVVATVGAAGAPRPTATDP